MYRYLLIVLLLFTSLSSLKAQRIRNVEFSQLGNTIKVDYRITNLDPFKVLEADLFVSQNGGRTFEGPLKAVSGDVGIIETEGSKSIIWRLFEEYAVLEGNIVFEVRVTVSRKPIPAVSFLSLTGTMSHTGGLTFGMVSRWGWYVSVKSNASFERGSHMIRDNMIMDFDRPSYYIMTDDIKTTRAGITAGIMRRIHKTTYLYAGMGYGQRILLWQAEEFSYDTHEMIESIIAEQPEGTFKNAEADAGIIFRFGNFNMSLGASTIGFQFFEPHLGIGYFFDF